MRRTLSLILSLSILLILLLPGIADAESRVVLTIGDITDRSGSRMDGDDQLGLWQYLEDQLDVEIRFVYLTDEDYPAEICRTSLPPTTTSPPFSKTELHWMLTPILRNMFLIYSKAMPGLPMMSSNNSDIRGKGFIFSLRRSGTTESDTAVALIIAVTLSAGIITRSLATRR